MFHTGFVTPRPVPAPAGEDEQVRAVEAPELFVEIAQAGRDAGNLAAALERGLGGDERLGQRLGLFAGSGVTWGYAVIDAAIAAVFWRQARKSFFALPLFYLHFADVALYFLTTVFDVKEWWLFAAGFMVGLIVWAELALVLFGALPPNLKPLAMPS